MKAKVDHLKRSTNLTKLLVRWTKKQWEKTQIMKIRNEAKTLLSVLHRKKGLCENTMNSCTATSWII